MGCVCVNPDTIIDERLRERYDGRRSFDHHDYSCLTKTQKEFLLSPEIASHNWPPSGRKGNVGWYNTEPEDLPLFGIHYAMPVLTDCHIAQSKSQELNTNSYERLRLHTYLRHQLVDSHKQLGEYEHVFTLIDGSPIIVRFMTLAYFDDFHP
jgi:hypothetical protein